MRTMATCLLVSIQLLGVCAELVFRQLVEGESLQLSCSLQEQQGRPTGLHLYHRGGPTQTTQTTQTTLLSMAEGVESKVNPEHRGRLQLHGGLKSSHVNVSLRDLRRGDAGLYVWELSSGGADRSEEVSIGAAMVLLLLEGRPCQCSPGYPPLMVTLITAAGLLLFTLCWLALDKRMVRKVKKDHQLQPPVPIYEEMTSKQQQQASGIPSNSHEAPPHLEEVSFPVYANPNIRPPQENYYACPRQLLSNVHTDCM